MRDLDDIAESAKALYAREAFRDCGHARNYDGRGRNGIWMRKGRPVSGGPKISI